MHFNNQIKLESFNDIMKFSIYFYYNILKKVHLFYSLSKINYKKYRK
jgi:hypothetical protein